MIEISILTLRDINKSFGELKVLKNISLNVEKGEIISLIGPSGGGKSTLLRSIIGLEEVDTGIIEFEGEPLLCREYEKNKLTNKKEQKAKYKKMGMVFQNFNLFPHKTVLQNIIEAPIIANRMDKKQAIIMAENLLNKVGILSKKDDYPDKLSGGQKQRVAIARALAMSPDIMLFDEPTSALDPELVAEVLKAIKDLANDHMTMLIVTHEMNFARDISNRIIFMENGEIVEDITPDKIFCSAKSNRIKEFMQRVI